jgi:MFS family permease
LSQLQRARIAVLALFTLNGSLFGTWASRLPAIQQTFDLSTHDLGFLLLLPAAGAIASFPMTGALSDRYGAARVAKIIALFLCPALLLVAWSGNIYAFGLSLMFIGAALGALDVAMNGWGAEIERAIGRPIMSSFHAMFSLGMGTGAAGGALAAWLEMTYPVHLTIFAFLAVNLLWLAYCDWPNVASASVATTGSKAGFTLPRGKLLIVAAVAFAAAMSEGGMADWSALFLTNVLHASESEGATGFAVFSTAMVIMRLSGDRIVSALGPALTIRCCGLSAIFGSLFTIVATLPLMVYIGYFLMGIGYSIVFPLVFSRAANDGQLSAGRSIAAVSVFGYGGLMLGPPLIGFLAEETSLRITFALFTLLALVVFLGAGAFRQLEKGQTNLSPKDAATDAGSRLVD